MRINIKNTAKIQAALDSVNGRATSHVMRASDVSDIAARADSKLSASGVAIAARRGVRVCYVPSGPGKAYSRRGRYVATNYAILERGPTGWFLVSCERRDVYSDAREQFKVVLTDGLGAVIRQHAMRGYIEP